MEVVDKLKVVSEVLPQEEDDALDHLVGCLEGLEDSVVTTIATRVQVNTRWPVEYIAWVDALAFNLRKPRWEALRHIVEIAQQELEHTLSPEAKARLKDAYKAYIRQYSGPRVPGPKVSPTITKGDE